VGNEFIVGIRYTADEMAKGGLTAKDTIKILKQLKKDGLVDFLNVI
jgi:2,4-dienoyl-CoA reductase-like NADH-dependent reductase (Old Yellow Enzyme family)